MAELEVEATAADINEQEQAAGKKRRRIQPGFVSQRGS